MLKKSFYMTVAAVAVAGQAHAAAHCSAFTQAPMLDAAVADGTLPAVADRLPTDPVVVETVEAGTYGGTLRGIWPGSRLADYRHYGYEPLVRWSPDGSEVLPNIAASWEVSEDGTAYTFSLREGLKWSDGEAFTADDILFWWNNVETNPDVQKKGAYRIFKVAGEAATVEKIDDMTVRFSWSKPNGRFLLDLASPYGQRVVQFPEHYVAQFDRDLNPEGVAAMMAEAGEEDYAKWWITRVGTYGKNSEHNDPMRPTMLAWKGTDSFLDKTYFTLERNPYYFRVDENCQQLPYIDERSYELVKDDEVMVLKIMAGDFDYSLPGFSVPGNKGVFFENMERGDYRFVEANSCDHNTMMIEMPFNSPDAFKAEFYQNKAVREALSVAIDRPGIIDTVYLGQGQPYQVGPRPGSPYYNEQLAIQFTEFDPARAIEILDELYPAKDAQGFRLRSDNGERISLNIIAEAGFSAEWTDVLMIMAQNYADIGLELDVEPLNGEQYTTRRTARDREMQVWAGENGCGQIPTISLARMIRNQSNWDNWINWVNDNIAPQTETVEGVEPIEPPLAIQRLYEIEATVTSKVGAEKEALLAEFFQLLADEFVVMGTALPAGDYRVVSNRIAGVYGPITEGWLFPGPAPTNMEAWYVK